jgi:hypothetical protein
MKVKYPELFKACPAAEKFQGEFQRSKGEFQRWSDRFYRTYFMKIFQLDRVMILTHSRHIRCIDSDAENKPNTTASMQHCKISCMLSSSHGLLNG